ncbi:hypothetical protein IW140_001619 [Coemansia sp. RSA 1813]|nr:hypothetical protein EV178_001620 [Coemansia sp. RSA 1646]KAJ1773458.1 hypothetical protein LPJ74_000711 [Coemansia sp. RSA 1843]KAJ2091287.1 hypothetical protein IW138_001986 [Coemansia sp. RSA 986]KAJ2571439.1 hypothetical protein IW140_001619 [Coemansia sp. RSA 1813]
MNSFNESPIDMPPADWCITTLQTLNNKYERITDSRKVNHPFAEAVLNSFKSKLLNIVSSQSFYDSDSVSDEETEWTPLPSDTTYDAATSNYISIPSSSSVDVADISSCYDTSSVEETEDDVSACISSPLPSPTGINGDDVYLGTSADFGSPQPSSFDTTVSSDFVTLPPNIEEALRRILANTNGQVLSDTFTTFANASETTLTGATTSTTSSTFHKSEEDEEDDDDNGAEDEDEDDDSRFVSESGNCSPDSLDSPEGSMDYMATEDSVDIFVKTFTANGGWEAVESKSKSAVSAAAPSANDNCLTPCKRKRSSEAEDILCSKVTQDKNSIPRNKAIISPRKRSRSVNHNDAAAVPTAEGKKKGAGSGAASSTNSSPINHPSTASTPPVSPLLAMAITTGSDKSSSSSD